MATLAPEGAWLVVPPSAARTTAALDRLLDGAARACRADELRVRDARGDTGVHLLAVHGAGVSALATVMSIVEHRIAALHLAGERGAAALFHDGARSGASRGAAGTAAAAAAEHVGVSADEVLAIAAAHAVTAQPRIVRGPATETSVVWNTAVDDDFTVELAVQRLADVRDLAAYDLVAAALLGVPLDLAVRALELRGAAPHHLAAFRAWAARA